MAEVVYEEEGGMIQTISDPIDTQEEIEAILLWLRTRFPDVADTHYARQCEAMLRRLGKRVQDLDKLNDPIVVHVNMLRGTIAKPSVENIMHIYGHDFGAIAALERVRGLVLDAGYEHYDVGSVGMMRIRGVIDAEIERVKGDHAP